MMTLLIVLLALAILCGLVGFTVKALLWVALVLFIVFVVVALVNGLTGRRRL